MKISIITINYNNAQGLYKTIGSVVQQSYNNIEYIVIDGGSTDESISIILKYEPNITHWVSKPDKGIYDALNKGIDKATGSYLLFLNSGDCLYDKKVIENFYKSNPTADIVYGNTLIVRGKEKKIKALSTVCDLASSLTNTINHQSIFHSKRLFHNKRRYSLKYPLAADWVFINESVRKEKATFNYLDEMIAIYDGEGRSSNWSLVAKEQQDYLNSTYSSDFLEVLKSYKHQVALNKTIRNQPFIKQLVKIRSFLKNMIYGKSLKII